MSLEDFKEAFKKFTVVYLNKDWKNSFIEKRNAINKRIYRFNFTITEHDLPILLQKDTAQKEIEHSKKVLEDAANI
jgi:hypothetical protein